MTHAKTQEDLRFALEKAVAEAVRKRLSDQPAVLEINRVQFLSRRQTQSAGEAYSEVSPTAA